MTKRVENHFSVSPNYGNVFENNLQNYKNFTNLIYGHDSSFGVEGTIVTTPIPDNTPIPKPVSLFLFSSSLVGLALFKLKK